MRKMLRVRKIFVFFALFKILKLKPLLDVWQLDKKIYPHRNIIN